MLLVLDVGNTNTVLGLYAAEESGGEPRYERLVAHWRVGIVRSQTADEYGVLFRNLFAMKGMEARRVAGIIIASVVPPIDSTLREACEKYFGVTPLFIEPGVKTGMPVHYDNPAEVGADRVVNGVAAFEKFGGPCIVVDFGTATTFDAVSPKGEYLGGAIAPGIAISAEALFTRTSKLPRVEIKRPEKVIGRTTVEAIQSGLFYGYAGLTDRMITQMAAAMKPARPRVIATGGLAEIIAAESQLIDAVDADLTLRGLQIIWEKNR